MAIAEPSTPRTPPSGRQLLIQLLIVVVVMAALVVAIIGLLPGSGRRLSHVTADWIVVGVVLELAAMASYWWTFDLFFSRPPYRIGKRLSLQIGIGELGAFVIAPFGAGGPVVRFWALLKSGMPWTVVITRAVAHDLAFNLPYLVAALLLGSSAGQSPTAATWPAPARCCAPRGSRARTSASKPIVAVANSYTQFVPGHTHLQPVGQIVADAIQAAGGIPREFNTIAVDDGIAMGHGGMLYSLPST
jgi:hypothetical protein